MLCSGYKTSIDDMLFDAYNFIPRAQELQLTYRRLRITAWVRGCKYCKLLSKFKMGANLLNLYTMQCDAFFLIIKSVFNQCIMVCSMCLYNVKYININRGEKLWYKYY